MRSRAARWAARPIAAVQWEGRIGGVSDPPLERGLCSTRCHVAGSLTPASGKIRCQPRGLDHRPPALLSMSMLPSTGDRTQCLRSIP